MTITGKLEEFNSEVDNSRFTQAAENNQVHQFDESGIVVLLHVVGFKMLEALWSLDQLQGLGEPPEFCARTVKALINLGLEVLNES
ncbi:hypothetical protein CVT25_005327 [Psilocybe cyanescens]|uniref:Uncharacterized protein n=1 Tax=Psilocybe cyanescens TaxID=93625 RepID=A0A409VPV3_PSICY|nr:hypothetical protein CVT25_005327 [Psilocybe cyanescens]